jgi:hypothetical protein
VVGNSLVGLTELSINPFELGIWIACYGDAHPKALSLGPFCRPRADDPAYNKQNATTFRAKMRAIVLPVRLWFIGSPAMAQPFT